MQEPPKAGRPTSTSRPGTSIATRSGMPRHPTTGEDRRHWRKEATRWADEESAAEANYVATVGPGVKDLDEAITQIEERRDELQTARRQRSAWLNEHPEAVRRLQNLDKELHPLPELPEIQALGHHHAANLRHAAEIQPPSQGHGIELDFGP